MKAGVPRRDYISREDLKRLRTFRILPNLIKIPLFFGIMIFLAWLAWTTESSLLKWSTYLALGYLWMSIVTFMHDATHNKLFKKPWMNWVFGIVSMIPLMASFMSFKDDHNELMKPAIAVEGAIVEKSYTGVFLRALVRGPESEQRLERVLAECRPVVA